MLITRRLILGLVAAGGVWVAGPLAAQETLIPETRPAAADPDQKKIIGPMSVDAAREKTFAWLAEHGVKVDPPGPELLAIWQSLPQPAEAEQVLAPITADMPIIENGSYHRLLLLYKGLLKPEEVLRSFGADGGLDDVTTAYGVGNWHLYNGRPAEAEAIFARIIAARSQWASFGYLSAEAEMRRRVADR